ncbi:MAG: trypsin-like peptidase domain-containing protein [Eubacteriales bacterium]|jgi:serine protease Do|nr:trypsin-like peptidase domain-containing protein [Eubacteriales bacterium]
MEHNGFYALDQKPNHNHEDRGGKAFATIVIVIVLVLLALLVVGLFWPGLLGGTVPEYALIEVTPTPEPGAEATAPPAQQEQPTEAPAATMAPSVADADRAMPNLDGIAPSLPGFADNPIPDIYEAVSPGVVGVLNYVEAQSAKGRTIYTIYGSGTGFVVSSAGYILTNAHVVEGATKITIKIFGEDQEWDAVLIGSDSETDIAVLKVEGTQLQPLKLGNSDLVRVGEYVLAIGNPLSTEQLANTITFGIISATMREVTIENYTNTYLQTDAAINFGNSGGPLINLNGEVIGINSAKTITAGYDEMGNAVSAEGIGFALPINQARRIMEVLITKGYVERPGIGVTVSTVDADVAEAREIPVGALVESVVKDRPAALAGVLAGDIITEANGEPILTHQQLVNIVLSRMIGDELKIKVYRDGAYLDITIVIGNKTDMDFDNVIGATPTPLPEATPTPKP